MHPEIRLFFFSKHLLVRLWWSRKTTEGRARPEAGGRAAVLLHLHRAPLLLQAREPGLLHVAAGAAHACLTDTGRCHVGYAALSISPSKINPEILKLSEKKRCLWGTGNAVRWHCSVFWSVQMIGYRWYRSLELYSDCCVQCPLIETDFFSYSHLFCA